jgi:membrane-associated protein
MTYSRFLTYNVVGALVWVVSLVYAGVFFGNLPLIRNNLTAVILVIIGVSLLPLVFAFLREKLRKA